MLFDTPSPEWIPLSKALIYFHFTLWKEATPEQLLNAILSRLCKEHHEIHAELEDGVITISRLHKDSGHLQLDTIATYTVEDGFRYDSWLRNTPSEEFQNAASAVMKDFIERAEGAFRKQHAVGRCQIFARVETPLQSVFTAIPPDVFAHFAVTDWRKGIAASDTGERLFSIHAVSVEALPNEDELPEEGFYIEPSKTKKRKHPYEQFVQWAISENVSRETGSLEQIRRKYLRSPGGRKLDDKTLRKAFEVIDSLQGN